MRKLALLLICLCAFVFVKAQNVTESKITMAKIESSGFVIAINDYEQDVVESALKEKFDKQYNLKSGKGPGGGFKAYLNQPFQPFGSGNYDIYYKVETEGKKGARYSKLNLVVCTGNMNAVTLADNQQTAENIIAWMKEFAVFVKDHKLALDIIAATNALSKLQEEKSKLESDADKLQKNLEKVNIDIEKNKNAQNANREAIIKAQQTLDDLKALQN